MIEDRDPVAPKAKSMSCLSQGENREGSIQEKKRMLPISSPRQRRKGQFSSAYALLSRSLQGLRKGEEITKKKVMGNRLQSAVSGENEKRTEAEFEKRE